MTEGLQTFGTFALEGRTLMEFLGKNSAKDLDYPNTVNPNPPMGHYPPEGFWPLRLWGGKG